MMENEPCIHQAAAIPLKDGQVCLITSSSGRKWTIPKGIIDPGYTAQECALQEAWEEAGLEGELELEPVGSYRYRKWGSQLEVTVYLMRVTAAHDDWPEQSLRQRRWITAAEAWRNIGDASLSRLVQKAITDS